jgi:hypothetical protein
MADLMKKPIPLSENLVHYRILLNTMDFDSLIRSLTQSRLADTTANTHVDTIYNGLPLQVKKWRQNLAFNLPIKGLIPSTG